MTKFFYQPVKPFILNQGFGENTICINDNKKVINCDGNNPPDGYRSLYGPKGHLGADLRTAHGQEVYCAQNGTVDHIDTNPKSGLDVKIKTVIGGRTFLHIYEHLLGYQVKVGDKIKTGQLIGWADNTGYSSGDHLHWEVKEWLNGVWVSIDPLPLTEDIFALDILRIVDGIGWIKEQIARLVDNWASNLRSG